MPSSSWQVLVPVIQVTPCDDSEEDIGDEYSRKIDECKELVKGIRCQFVLKK